MRQVCALCKAHGQCGGHGGANGASASSSARTATSAASAALAAARTATRASAGSPSNRRAADAAAAAELASAAAQESARVAVAAAAESGSVNRVKSGRAMESPGRNQRCSAQTGKECPDATSHWSKSCRCMPNVQKPRGRNAGGAAGSATRSRSASGSAGSAASAKAAFKSDAAHEAYLKAKQAQADANRAKAKAETEAKADTLLGRYSKILGRPITSPSQITEADELKIELFDARRVQLFGLKAVQYNGLMGRVAYEQDGRYAVALDNGETRAFKAENIRVVEDSVSESDEDDEEASSSHSGSFSIGSRSRSGRGSASGASASRRASKSAIEAAKAHAREIAAARRRSGSGSRSRGTLSSFIRPRGSKSPISPKGSASHGSTVSSNGRSVYTVRYKPKKPVAAAGAKRRSPSPAKRRSPSPVRRSPSPARPASVRASPPRSAVAPASVRAAGAAFRPLESPGRNSRCMSLRGKECPESTSHWSKGCKCMPNETKPRAPRAKKSAGGAAGAPEDLAAGWTRDKQVYDNTGYCRGRTWGEYWSGEPCGFDVKGNNIPTAELVRSMNGFPKKA